MTSFPTSRRLTGALVVGLLSLAAAGCGSDGDSTASATVDSVVEDSMADEMTEDSMAEEAMSEDSMADEAMSEDSMAEEAMSEDSMVDEMTEDSMAEEAMADVPAWQALAITDVDGATFTLDDFHGRPVLVETFATWCPNCRSQLADTNTAAAEAGDAAVVVALSVETDIDPADVKRYAADNGFSNIRFAVVSPELLAALVDGFGQTIANPPSTPKFLIDPMGQAGELSTGSESAETLAMQLGVSG